MVDDSKAQYWEVILPLDWTPSSANIPACGPRWGREGRGAWAARDDAPTCRPRRAQDEDQVHGEDTIMKFLHTSKDIHGHVGPAVLGARVRFLSPVKEGLRCAGGAPARSFMRPAARHDQVLVNREKQTIYGIWPLGRFVCGHAGICHGGMTSLAIDEMSGQACLQPRALPAVRSHQCNSTVNAAQRR